MLNVKKMDSMKASTPGELSNLDDVHNTNFDTTILHSGGPMKTLQRCPRSFVQQQKQQAVLYRRKSQPDYGDVVSIAEGP